jgi:hypothetical protein
MVVKEEMVVVAKGKLLKSRLPRRSEKRKALDVKSAGASVLNAGTPEGGERNSRPMALRSKGGKSPANPPGFHAIQAWYRATQIVS